MNPPLPRFSCRKGLDLAAAGAAYDRDDLVILEEFAGHRECQKLMQRAAALISELSPGEFATVFSTQTQAHADAAYFQASGDKIRYFLEQEACNEAGELVVDKSQAVNKIGHALHDLDPAFDAFSHRKQYQEIALALGLRQPLLVQSMLIFKQPGIGGEVNCHQDASFLYTEPQTVSGFWLALEDATLENGCLWALHRRHREGIRSRFRRIDGALTMEYSDPAPWPESEKVPLKVRAGTLVVLHGQLPHLSGANRSDRSRQAYVVHMIDGTASYAEDNWLQRGPEMPFRGFA